MAEVDAPDLVAKTKACSICREELPLERFNRQPRGKYGRHSQCRACHARRDSAHYWADPELSRAKNRARVAANIESVRKTTREWYRRNKDSPRVIAARKKRYESRAADLRKLAREYRIAKPWISLLTKAKVRAAKGNLDFNLTKEWAASVWTGKCAVTGAEFVLGSGGRHARTPSIDRVIPALGYVQANCRFVLWAVNSFKGEGCDSEMLEIARLIVEGANGRG